MAKEIRPLDGFLWCDDCGSPLLSQGHFYVHPWELTKARLRELRHDRKVAQQLAEWVFYKLKRVCPEDGEAPPIAEEIPLTEAEFVSQLQTKKGIDDLYHFLSGLYQE